MKMQQIYEQPYARDLTGMGALGNKGPQPLSLCVPGHTIQDATCSLGATVNSPGSCAPTGQLQGSNPQCSAGGQGSRGCISGNNP